MSVGLRSRSGGDIRPRVTRRGLSRPACLAASSNPSVNSSFNTPRCCQIRRLAACRRFRVESLKRETDMDDDVLADLRIADKTSLLSSPIPTTDINVPSRSSTLSNSSARPQRTFATCFPHVELPTKS